MTQFDYTIQAPTPMRDLSNMITMRGQQIKQAGNQAEQDRFMEEGNFLSLLDGAQKFLALPEAPRIDPSQQVAIPTQQNVTTTEAGGRLGAATQNAPTVEPISIQDRFLRDRLSNIKSRDGDATDTEAMMRLNPEQRVQAAQNVIEIARQRGIIQPDAGAPTYKAAYDTQDQADVFASNQMIAEGGGRFTPRQQQPLVQIGSDGKVHRPAGDRKLSEGQGAFASKEIGEIYESGNLARKNRAKLERFSTLNKNIVAAGDDTGALAELRLEGTKLALALGVPKETIAKWGGIKSVAEFEAMRSTTMDFVLGQIQQTKGAISEREMAAFEKSVANIKNTPEGNEMIIQFGLRIADAEIQKEKFFRAYGRFDSVDQVNEAQRLWTEKADKEYDDRVAAGAAPTQPQVAPSPPLPAGKMTEEEWIKAGRPAQ